MGGPLQGVKVFDITQAGVGPWATMILAAMGANVIKLEPPGGDRILGTKPRYNDLSVVYMQCNLGKRSAFANLKSPEGQELARRLLKEADVFAENHKWGTVEHFGLNYEEVAKINPSIVYGNYPGWGSTGPMKDRGSADPSAQAFSGAVSTTGKVGGEGEFIRIYVLHDFNASSYIVTTTLLGLLSRERSGKGIKMENAQVASSIAVQTSRIAEFLASGKNVLPMGSACATTVPHRAFLCQDKRWLAVGVVTDAQWRGLCKAIDATELLDDPRFDSNSGRVKHRDELEDRLQAILASKPARWWTIQLRKRKVPVSLFHDYETIPDLPQIRANKSIISLKYPKAGTLPFSNLPFQYSKTPVVVKPGPVPGQDTEQVLKEGWGKNGATKAKGYFGPKGPMERGVLDGVTIVDMTQGLAGPYGSLMLADAGARVIKVEPPEGDYARNFGPPMVDGVSAAFFHLNRNKEGVRLDIQKSEDRQRLLKLLKDADVFIEEEGQRGLKRLGLSYQDLEMVNPGLVHCTISAHGTKGPLRNQPASELTLQAMSDHLATLGVAGEEPVRMGPDMASLGTSLFVTHGVLGALYHKWRTGEGQQINLNLLDTLIHQKGFTWTSMINPDAWNGHSENYFNPPHHGYKTDDQPILLSPAGGFSEGQNEQFTALLKALKMEEYLEHPLFQRQAREIMGFGGEGMLSFEAMPIWEEAFKSWKAEDLLDLLNSLGSNSSLVNNYEQLLAHPQMKAIGMVKEMSHPTLGKVKCLMSPWKLHGVSKATPEPYVEEGIR